MEAGIATQESRRQFQYAYGIDDDVNPVQETSGATVLDNILTGLGIDGYLARSDSSGSSYFLPDGLGSTLALSDSTGTIQTEYTYEPFGKTTSTGASNGNPFQFTGRENDATGLYYYRARYYHPQLQRFLAEDLLNYVFAKLNSPFIHIVPRLRNNGPFFAMLAGDQAGRGLLSAAAFANAYSYANNDPARFVDPLGLWYVDLNLSGGFPVAPGVSIGLSGGIQIGPSGIHPYVGPGLLLGPSPVSGSATWSPDNISPGWNCGLQGTMGGGLSGQIGGSIGSKSDDNPFVEIGGGGPPGVTASCYYVW